MQGIAFKERTLKHIGYDFILGAGDGEEYIIVNDPASPNRETVRREYKLSEFEKAWGGIVYVLRPDFE